MNLMRSTRFSAARQTDARGTGARFRPRELPAVDAAAFIRAGIESVPRQYHIEVLIHAPAAAVRAETGRWASIEEISDQQCLMRSATDSLEWSAMFLGAVGAEF